MVRNTLSHLATDRRGNVAITFGLMIIPAVMFVGGAIDFGRAYQTKQKIQAATDSAVLAAAAMPSGTSSQDRQTRAQSLLSANTAGIAGITPTVTVNGNTISVQAIAAQPTSFLKIARIDSLSVSARASGSVAYASTTQTTTTQTTVNGGYACLLALDPSAANGMISQGTPNVDYTGCWAHTNSTSASAIAGGGSAVVTGAGHSAVGGVSSTALGVYTPTPVGNQAVIPDPFATVSAYATPTSSYQSTFTPPSIPDTCKASSLNLKKGTFEIEGGRYCGGINIQAGATVNFKPGVYIVDNGQLNIQSGATVTGSDVLFYLYGTASGFQMIGGGQGSINLKGRTSGSSDLKGFLLIAHPNAWRGLTSNIQGGSSFTMEGMIYAPTQNIIITGNGDSNASSNMFAMVAKSFEFRGNGLFRFKPWSSSSTLPNILPARTTTVDVQTETTVSTIDKVKLE